MPFHGYTKAQAAAIRETLNTDKVRLKKGVKWSRILPDITTAMADLHEGASVPGAVAYPTKKEEEFKSLTTSLDDAARECEQMGERYQWHLDDQLERLAFDLSPNEWHRFAPTPSRFIDMLNDLRHAAKQAKKLRGRESFLGGA